VNETNKIVNELVDIFAGKVMTQHENEVLYRTFKLIHDLEDQAQMYKSMIYNRSNVEGKNH
jgi:hypothetical protein